MKPVKQLSLKSLFPYLIVVGGLLGLIASLILTHDTLAILKNPNYVPSCNLNPVLSCGDVINTPGDTILGLAYPFYGIGVFMLLIGAGVGMLAGAKYKRWYWLTFQTLMTLGVVGAYYLLIKSVYTIHALCPFCLSIDVIVTTLFWYTSLYNLDNKVIKLKNKRLNSVYSWVRKHHLDLLVLWFLIVIGLLLKHFWYYYGKHL
jgi:uncharacterized membrane protein